MRRSHILSLVPALKNARCLIMGDIGLLMGRREVKRLNDCNLAEVRLRVSTSLQQYYLRIQTNRLVWSKTSPLSCIDACQTLPPSDYPRYLRTLARRQSSLTIGSMPALIERALQRCRHPAWPPFAAVVRL